MTKRSSVCCALFALALPIAGCGGVAEDSTDGPTGKVASPLTSLLIEAEGSVGAGTTEADPTASGSALLSLTVPGSTATKSFTTAGPTVSGRVRVRGSSACLSGQWLKVLVDGATVLTEPVTSTAWTERSIAVAGLPAGPHSVGFGYRAGTNGCPLRFDRVTFDVDDPPPDPPDPPPPILVQAESATGAGSVGSDVTASGGQYRSLTVVGSTAMASFSTSGALQSASVRARATSCAVTQWIKVTVDSQTVLTQPISATTWTEIPLGLSTLLTGPHQVGFNYRSGSSACPLHFDVATFQTN